MPARILTLDDDRATCNLLELGLRAEGYDVVSCTRADEALALLETQDFSVVITDLNMQDMSGIEVCKRVAADRPELPVIVITAFGSLESAISAMRAGAYDFITKPFEMDGIVLALERAIRHRELQGEVRRLRAVVQDVSGFGDLIGKSPAMMQLYSLLDRISESDSTVLIQGESGTGKELVAHALHAKSRRAGKPFVAVNCAALPEPLLESELFGHVRGAFTDAVRGKLGLLKEADAGTLFLDEIGDMPYGLQAKLLRALEQKCARPVGGSSEVAFDVRVIAATHRDLEASIEAGQFREDLYYRLNVITVTIPPLRSRGGDILLLAQHLVQVVAERTGKAVVGFSSSAAQKLLAYSWPGNVRELRNCIERAVALTRYDRIGVEDLPEKVRDYTARHVIVAGDDLSEFVPLEEVEKRYILRVLEAAGGNKSLAAQTLGLNRKTLYRKLASYGMS